MLEERGRRVPIGWQWILVATRFERVTKVEQFSRDAGFHFRVSITLFHDSVVQIIQNEKLTGSSGQHQYKIVGGG